MNQDIQTFIIWKNARCFEEEILEKIKARFKILKEYEITWTPELFGENLSAFYGDNFVYNMFQRKTRGEGSFVLVIVEDKNPNYISTTANRGEVLVNEKAFNLKQEVRKLTKTFSFHSSNDMPESRHDIALLLGKNLNDFLNTAELDGKREFLNQDIPSARGWKSLSEFFYILNETCNYVLLRSFDAIPDTHTYKENGDVDLLVDDIKKFVAILNPTAPLHKNAFHFFNWIDFGEDNKNLLIHPKFIGDNYYDINMQKKTLETRRLNEKGVYVPTDEMYFWTLLHHGVFHKENWQKYDSIFKDLAPKIGVEYKADKEYLCNLMADYMKENGYKVAKHLDNGAASLIPQNIKDTSILKSEPTLYWYNNSTFRFFVFSEEAIYYEPELVTKFINIYDIFLDLQRHVLDSNSYIYRYVKSRMQNGEYLWSFAKRKDKFSVFSYKNIDGVKSFKKHFIPEQECLKTDYVTYIKQDNLQYLNCNVKVEDILLGTYVVNGYDAFLWKLDNFLGELFFKYELSENINYLMPVAWDYLPKNVFCIEKQYVAPEYIFFDTEAKYNKPIRKSQAIANVVLEFDDKFFFSDEERYSIYKYFVNKYVLEDIWVWAQNQRKREITEIIFNPISHDTCDNAIELLIQNNSIKNTEENMQNNINISKNSGNFEKNFTVINANLKENNEHILYKTYQSIDTKKEYCEEHLLVSIIMPVYNGQDFVGITLDSVLSQTLKNIEIICVNDGSTDNTKSVLEEYSAKDGRIKIVNKENGGQASARNKGVELAKGDFIGFIDSDDTIPADYYQILYESATNNDADIVHCRYSMITEDGKSTPWNQNDYILTLDSRNPYFNKLNMTYASGVVWNKIYKKHLFDETMRFIDDTSPWEDNPFIAQITQKAKRIIAVPETFYYYLQRNDSSIHAPKPRVHFKLLRSTECLIDYLNNPKNDIPQQEYKEFYSQITNRMNHEYLQMLNNPNCTKKDRKKYDKWHHRIFFKIKYLSLTDKLNCTNEYHALKRHLNKFLKPFKIIELMFRLIKNVALAPYYFIKEELLK